MSDWWRETTECVSCPQCAFTFAADHTDEPDGGYSCPSCAEAALTARVAQLEACLTDVKEQLEMNGAPL